MISQTAAARMSMASGTAFEIPSVEAAVDYASAVPEIPRGMPNRFGGMRRLRPFVATAIGDPMVLKAGASP
jgi:hypothetical protein